MPRVSVSGPVCVRGLEHESIPHTLHFLAASRSATSASAAGSMGTRSSSRSWCETTRANNTINMPVKPMNIRIDAGK